MVSTSFLEAADDVVISAVSSPSSILSSLESIVISVFCLLALNLRLRGKHEKTHQYQSIE